MEVTSERGRIRHFRSFPFDTSELPSELPFLVSRFLKLSSVDRKEYDTSTFAHPSLNEGSSNRGRRSRTST